MKTDMKKIRKKVKKALDKERFAHTMGVAYTAECLAMAHGLNMEKAFLAGLLHDCAKCIPNEQKLILAGRNGIILSPIEVRNPYLIHAKLGAFLARTEYGVKDKEILHAIEVHTTGEPHMSDLDKVLFIADYIEPNRDKADNLEAVRQKAFTDLDDALLMILSDTLTYLGKTARDIDPSTEEAYVYYRDYKIERNR